MINRPPAIQCGFETEPLLYEEARPEYPRRVLELLEGAGVQFEDARLLDVGCGTGKLLHLFTEGGNTSAGIDLSLAMLRVFRQAKHRIPLVNGAAEYLPFRSRSFSIVVSGQAFHWFETSKALSEFRRVLRVGGHAVLVWNVRDRTCAVYQEVDAFVEQFRHNIPRWDNVDWGACIRRSGGFSAPCEHEISWTRKISRLLLIDLVMTRSYIARRSSVERRKIRETLGEIVRPGEGNRSQYIGMTYLCRIVIARAE